jgi:hypothetical protein
MPDMSVVVVAVMSVITYLQNLGATLNLPKIDLPEEARQIFQYVTKFLDILLRLIPALPAFDLRAQLVIIAFLLPLLLTIVFVWFVTPFIQVIRQTLDILVVAMTSMCVAAGFLGEWSTGKRLASVGGGLYLLLRLLLKFAKRGASSSRATVVAEEVCAFYMEGIVPDVEAYTDSRKELMGLIRYYCRHADLEESRPSFLYLMGMFAAILVLLALALWAVGLIPLDVGRPIPVAVKVFFPYVGFPLALLLLIALILVATPCGRRILLVIKRFVKRWGLRLLMLCLELLYVPILTGAVPLFSVKQTSCGVGQFLLYEHAPSPVNRDPFFEFVNHTSACAPCDMQGSMHGDWCIRVCSGKPELRLLELPNLLFVEDVVKTSSGILLYCLIVVMCGIPALFYRITKMNRDFARKIYVWGGNVVDKWNALVYRLETTGIFLFAIYKYHVYWWSILLFVFKFVLMLVTTIAGRVWPPIIIGLPVVYLAMIIAALKFRPYLFTANNVLNVLLYVCNLLFSAIPVGAYFNFQLPQTYYLPLAIALIALPVLSLIVLLFCKHSVFDPDDPTIDPEAKARIGVKEGGSRPKSTRVQPEKELQDIAQDFGGTKRGEKAPQVSDSQLTDAIRGLIKKKKYDPTTPGIDQTVPPGFLESIKMFEHIEHKLDERNHTESFTVPENMIRSVATQMYHVLDIIIDGMTITALAKALYWSMMLGSLGFGWYLGGIRTMADAQMSTNFVCS